jgi:hypothetical protein
LWDCRHQLLHRMRASVKDSPRSPMRRQ